MLVKVCGITTLRDALLSVRLGANALGFNFYRSSPRYLELKQARQILLQLPEATLRVAVVVHPYADYASLPAEIDLVQVHGLQCEADLPRLNRPIMVAVSPEGIGLFPKQSIIVDTSWGQGKTTDWDLLKDVKRRYVLSGGLRPSNVKAALERLQPAGVDVCSGVEKQPGLKDPKKLEAFMQQCLSFVAERAVSNETIAGHQGGT